MSSRLPFRRQPPTGIGSSQPAGTSTGSASYPKVKVILHRTPNVSLTFVARTVMELTHFGEAEATYRMWDVHYNGRTLVLVTHRERAELYAEQFGERGLAVTLEPA
jgi:ATP-dependent Clp protease adapter protein ClpS